MRSLLEMSFIVITKCQLVSESQVQAEIRCIWQPRSGSPTPRLVFSLKFQGNWTLEWLGSHCVPMSHYSCLLSNDLHRTHIYSPNRQLDIITSVKRGLPHLPLLLRVQSTCETQVHRCGFSMGPKKTTQTCTHNLHRLPKPVLFPTFSLVSVMMLGCHEQLVSCCSVVVVVVVDACVINVTHVTLASKVLTKTVVGYCWQVQSCMRYQLCTMYCLSKRTNYHTHHSPISMSTGIWINTHKYSHRYLWDQMWIPRSVGISDNK